jgi:hypothetical protein
MVHRIAVLLAALVVATGGACSDEKSYVDKFVHDLRPGDCFDGSPSAPQNAGEERTGLVVAALPCSQPHLSEVFAVFEHPDKPGGHFPGEEEVAKVAQDGCAERFAGYVGHPFGDSELQVVVIAPGAVYWGEDDRTIVCTLQGGKPLKGSQKTDGD